MAVAVISIPYGAIKRIDITNNVDIGSNIFQFLMVRLKAGRERGRREAS